jgi:hypothetical protein
MKWPLAGGVEERREVDQEMRTAVEGNGEAFAEIKGGVKEGEVEAGTATKEWNDHGYREAEKANEGEGASMSTDS